MHRPAHGPRVRSARSSKLVLLWMLLGLAGLDALIAGAAETWRRYEIDDYRERLAACRAGPHDLVIVGGSPASEGFHPATLSRVTFRGATLNDVFNFGLPGGTVAEFWHALRHGLVAPPKLVVYAACATDMNNARLEPHGPNSLMTAADVAEWIRLRPRSAEWATRHFVKGRIGELSQFNAYRRAMRLAFADWADGFAPGLATGTANEARLARIDRPDFDAGRGYAPNRHFRERRLDQLKAGGYRLDRFPFLERYAVGEHTPHLDCLFDWLETQGVAALIVDMPVTRELQDELHPAAFATYRNFIQGFAGARHVQILDAHRDIVGLTDADFADFIHLNRYGAERLSAWLREQITALPD